MRWYRDYQAYKQGYQKLAKACLGAMMIGNMKTSFFGASIVLSPGYQPTPEGVPEETKEMLRKDWDELEEKYAHLPTWLRKMGRLGSVS